MTLQSYIGLLSLTLSYIGLYMWDADRDQWHKSSIIQNNRGWLDSSQFSDSLVNSLTTGGWLDWLDSILSQFSDSLVNSLTTGGDWTHLNLVTVLLTP